jgi:hypothetical protein
MMFFFFGSMLPIKRKKNQPVHRIMWGGDLEIEDIKACARYATDLVRSEEIHVEGA